MFKSVNMVALILALIIPGAVFGPFSLENKAAIGEVKKQDKDWNYIEAKTKLGNEEEEESQVQTPNLTEEQVKQLEDLSLKILDLRKQLIDKYVEFGVMDKERAEKAKQFFDRRFQKMKESQFMPRRENFHKKGHEKDMKEE
ncbi:MAG TPA: YckD family protein [Bacillota bacterium]|nr:YckD family protein [Bacillota bacterium]